MVNEQAKTPEVEQPETDTLDTVEVPVDASEPAAADSVEVDSLRAELEMARAEIERLNKELTEQPLRTAAEIQNIRRRAEQDVEKAHKYALDKFAQELLPVIDSLERAIEACSADDEAVRALREGVEMTLSLFLGSVAKFNLEPVDPVGQAFNPELHQAMSMVDAAGAEPGSVVAVMQKGYTLNGRLVRPAMVMVAKG